MECLRLRFLEEPRDESLEVLHLFLVSLTLGGDVIRPSDHVRLLGVTFAEDLSQDRHVSNVCKSCFFWLRQLRRVRRSLDIESVKTLVHAFVTSRVDYCNWSWLFHR